MANIEKKDFYQIIVGSVTYVLKTMADLNAKFVIPNEVPKDLDFTSSIGAFMQFKSKHVIGRMTVCMQKNAFMQISGKLTKQEIKELTPENSEYIGEITNIIYGQVKKCMDEKGYQMEKSFPRVMSFDEITHEQCNIDGADKVKIYFNTEVGYMYVNLCFRLINAS